MTTTIAVKDELVKKAMELTGLKTEAEVAEKAFNDLIKMTNQEALRNLRGKLQWDGNLEQMRICKI